MHLWRVADEEQREAGATTSERQTLGCRSPLGDERRGGEANPVTPTKYTKPRLYGGVWCFCDEWRMRTSEKLVRPQAKGILEYAGRL